MAGTWPGSTWRLLYKPPISKRVRDLQWCVLHIAILTNHFVSRFNPDVMLTGPGHGFSFFLLNVSAWYLCFLFYRHGWGNLGFCLIRICFFSVRYSKERKEKCTLANFLLGKAKLAIYKTHKTEREDGGGVICSVDSTDGIIFHV